MVLDGSPKQAVAVAAIEELVLVQGEQGPGMVFIQPQGVQSGAGGEIAEPVGVIREEPVGDATR